MNEDWEYAAPGGWYGIESKIQLSGWSHPRRNEMDTANLSNGVSFLRHN